MLSLTRSLACKRLAHQSVRSFSTRLATRPQFIQNKPSLLNSVIISKRYTSSDSDALEQGITDLDMNTYHNISEEYLETMTDSLEALSEENPQVDAEYSHGVLTLVLPPNGTYVINKQPPNKQIWLSSPISGPDRFDYVEPNWVSLRTKHKLAVLLKEEVAQALGKEADEIDLAGLDE